MFLHNKQQGQYYYNYITEDCVPSYDASTDHRCICQMEPQLLSSLVCIYHLHSDDIAR